MTDHLFSIICATYNRSTLLARAINSVVSQSFTDWELIIVDDGSTDETDNIVAPYLNDERVKYIKLESNRGVGFARNVGLASATGSWVVLLDSDNSLVPDALSIMDLSQKSTPCVMMHKFLVRSFDSRSMCDPLEHSVVVSDKDYLCGKFRGEFHTLVAREYIERASFFEEFSGGEGIVWSKIALDVKKVAFHPHATLLYETCGNDRLSLRSKNYSRLAKVFRTDITMLWKSYIRYCPSQLFVRVVKFILYSLASRLIV